MSRREPSLSPLKGKSPLKMKKEIFKCDPANLMSIFPELNKFFFLQMLFHKVILTSIQKLHVSQLRWSSRSALFVSGKTASHQFAVFKPNIDIEWMRDNIEMLDYVHQTRKGSFDVNALLADLESYVKLKDNVSEINSSLDEVQSVITERKKEKADIKDQIAKHKEIKKSLVTIRDSMWELEEATVVKYLKLQNCDAKSRKNENVHYSLTRGHNEEDILKGHYELCEMNNLVEFSKVAHSAFYARNLLSLMELKICKHLTSQLLESDFELFSNPDFIKSVMAEGCGQDFTDPSQVFSLRETHDFGDKDSCNGVHLVGGSSLAPFVSYFARNILTNADTVLPVTMFCVGRQYSPVTSSITDMLNTTQSQNVQIFSVSQSQDEMENQLQTILDTLINMLSVFPNFSITEESILDCDHCNSRQYKIEMKVMLRLDRLIDDLCNNCLRDWRLSELEASEFRENISVVE